MINLGIDIGSTTVKIVAVENDEIIYRSYERHYSAVRQKICQSLIKAKNTLEGKQIKVAISGSAGLGLSKATNLPFVQEVYATGELITHTEPDCDVVIELGGEDAKILFFDKKTGAIDERMNGTCAGGTGAFIDQMASLLSVDVTEFDKLALTGTNIYNIASRCGVFAKSDVQPLINQGAQKGDIALSIFQAVVDQTISGLAQGKSIKGKVLFLGGPLYFCKALQARFQKTLKLNNDNAVFPEYALYSVALGTSYYASGQGELTNYQNLLTRVQNAQADNITSNRLPPLFKSKTEYEEFVARHNSTSVPIEKLTDYEGNIYLGIDCGSTTTKIIMLSEDNKILYSYYGSNCGSPIEVIKSKLMDAYLGMNPKATIKASCCTGYGEDLVKEAFGIDYGLVETMAHLQAAQFFCPKVDYVLDIGGQDIKCFKIKDGAIDDIKLNEACSSGCGSFLESFAKSMGYTADEFAKLGLFATRPVDLGSRCTVFMNSRVKQAQKEGASIEDISAGLCISVVKNALYKVIRAETGKSLGENIVVQGGTFYNDSVLRGFEQEVQKNVTRPSIAGLMGAFGCAIFAHNSNLEQSKILNIEELKNFKHSTKTINCGLCNNNCCLTINIFGNNKKYISGNKCERPLKLPANNLPNLYKTKFEYLRNNTTTLSNPIATIGIPMGLNMYDNIVFWRTFFQSMNIQVEISDISTRALYRLGQFSIPSDTACYPAKLMHGHIINLLNKGIEHIFYPCLPYSFSESNTDNHFNCPVVAYYPQLLKVNMEELKQCDYWCNIVAIDNPKKFCSQMFEYLNKRFGIELKQIKKSRKLADIAYQDYRNFVQKQGQIAINYANQNNKRILVLAGRPYHIDPEINHGIDKLANSLGFVVISEDSIANLSKTPRIHVLNQWAFHSRLYKAANYVSTHPNMSLVQLVSFGCGIDAVTTDEVRKILERNNKLYTQLKIDEIANLGAVKIRLRSLAAALDKRENVQSGKNN